MREEIHKQESDFKTLGFVADIADIIEKINNIDSDKNDCLVAETTMLSSVSELSYDERLNTDKEFYAQEMEKITGKRRTHTKIDVLKIEIIPEKSGKMLRIDPELGRLAIHLKEAYLLRVWAIAQDITRNGSGDGRIDKNLFLRDLRLSYGVTFTDRRFRQWIVSGNDIYWSDTGEYLYISGRETLARIMTERAIATCPQAIETNRPGVNDMFVESGGSLSTFEAHLYEAWFSYRENPIIARATLSMLFGRDKKTLLRWEKHLPQLEIITNYHHTVEIDIAPVGAQISLTTRNQILYVKQASNTYRAKTRQHTKRGSSSKVRKISNEVLRIQKSGGCVPKRYFDSENKARQFSKKHGSSVMVFLGFNRFGQGIWELTPDGICETSHLSRVNHKKESAYRSANFSDYAGYIEGQRGVFCA